MRAVARVREDAARPGGHFAVACADPHRGWRTISRSASLLVGGLWTGNGVHQGAGAAGPRREDASDEARQTAAANDRTWICRWLSLDAGRKVRGAGCLACFGGSGLKFPRSEIMLAVA